MKCPKCNSENSPDTHFCKKCGFPLKASEKGSISQTKTLNLQTIYLKKGRIFDGRYEVKEEIGQGGMGKVYRVFDRKIEEDVALKLIRTHIATDKHAIERFRNELKVARKISHKNVCRMYDLNECSGIHYITMEYVEGEDLKTLLDRKKKLTPMDAINMGIQICKGLAEAHELGIVHRDLKPQNIMIDKKGNVHIMDFGIARSLDTSRVTEVGKTVGTPRYMSPEQIEGQDLDQRSDIYSLGIVLYELLVGHTPFDGTDLVSVAVKHKTEAPKFPKEMASGIPKRLSNLILKCLEKEGQKRYQSTKELLSALYEVKKEISKTSKYFESKRRDRSYLIRFMMNKKNRVAVVVLITVMLGAFLVWLALINTGFIEGDEPNINEIKKLMKENDFVSAFRLAVDTEKKFPENSRVKKLLPKVSKEIDIHTNPEGAEIYYMDPSGEQEDWQYLGMTPIERIIIPRGNLFWRAEKEGYQSVSEERLCKGNTLNWELARAEGISEIIGISKKSNTIRIEGGTEIDSNIGTTGKIFNTIEDETGNKVKKTLGSFIVTEVNKNESIAEIINQEEEIAKGCLVIFDHQPKGMLSISCNPKDAKVYIDNTYKGVTDLKLLLEPELYNLKIVKENYIGYSKEIELLSAQSLHLDVFLKPISPKNGQLVVTSRPSGAEVIFDDSDIAGGKTPFNKEIDPGKYIIRLHLDDYKEEVCTFEVKAGKKFSRHFDLESQKGVLEIDSEPSGAKVYIDNKSESLGITPFKMSFPPKKYNIRLVKEGHEEQNHEVIVSSGETTSRHFSLNKEPKLDYLLVVNTVPSNADVYINGKKQNKQTPVDVKLNDPHVNLRIEKQNYKTYVTTMDLDEPVEVINYNLKKLNKSTLIIGSYRKANVELNGKLQEKSVPPELKLEVYEGSHTVRFIFDDNLFIERTEDLKGGETKKIHCDAESYSELIKQKCKYEFGAWPECEVKVDENFLKKTVPPIESKWVDEGKHRIRYKCGDLTDFIINDTLTKGIKKKLHVNYEVQEIKDLDALDIFKAPEDSSKNFIIISSNPGIDVSIDGGVKNSIPSVDKVTIPVDGKNINQINLFIKKSDVNYITEINIIKTEEKRMVKAKIEISLIK